MVMKFCIVRIWGYQLESPIQNEQHHLASLISCWVAGDVYARSGRVMQWVASDHSLVFAVCVGGYGVGFNATAFFDVGG